MTNEYGDGAGVVAAADDEGYVVLNVYGNTSLNDVRAHFINNRRAKYVFQEDWTATGTHITGYDNSGKLNNSAIINGNVIWDLHGHTVNFFERWGEFALHYLEIRDSSTAGTGRIEGRVQCTGGAMVDVTCVLRGGTVNGDLYVANAGSYNEAVDMYGGTINGCVGFDYFNSTTMHTDFHLYGGTVTQGVRTSNYPAAGQPLNVTRATPSYARVTYDASGNIAAITSPDYFAVSSSDTVCGAFNYAYGYAWELNAAALDNLAVPATGTYYLWGRSQGEWYHYLGVRYVDGVCDQPLGGMATWTKYYNSENVTLTDNTVTINCQGGWEIFGVPVRVPTNADCVLSVNVQVGDFASWGGSLPGLHMAVLTKTLPQDLNPNLYPAGTVLTDQYILPNTNGQVELSFNSGDCDTVYLVLNGGGLKDGVQVVTFNFDDWRLKTKTI